MRLRGAGVRWQDGTAPNRPVKVAGVLTLLTPIITASFFVRLSLHLIRAYGA